MAKRKNSSGKIEKENERPQMEKEQKKIFKPRSRPQDLLKKKKHIGFVIFILLAGLGGGGGVVSQAAQQLRELINPKACPNVIEIPGTYITLKFMTLGGVERHCCGCNPGTYLDKLCADSNDPTTTVCKPCNPGTYLDEYAHDATGCKIDDLTCPRGMIKIPGKLAHAPRCDCPPGFYKADHSCLPHTSCRPGKGVKILPTSFRDTVCEDCIYGYESPYWSTKDGCTAAKSVRELEANRNIDAAVWPNPTVADTDQSLGGNKSQHKCPPFSPTLISIESYYQQLIRNVLPGWIIALIAFAIIVGLLVSKWRRANNNRPFDNESANSLIAAKDSNSSSTEFSVSVDHAHPAQLNTSRDEEHLEIDPNISIMMRIRNTLCSKMSWDDVVIMLRGFEERFSCEVSSFLADLRRQNISPCEQKIKVFEELGRRLGEKFNPQTLCDVFENGTNINLQYSNVVKGFLGSTSVVS